MLDWLRKVAAPIVAIAVLGLASAAWADTVTYKTSGQFTAASGDSVGTTTTANDTLNSGSDKLIFTGNLLGSADTTNPNNDQPPLLNLGYSLGEFELKNALASHSFNPGDMFYLTITQIAPAGGTGNSQSNVSATINFSVSSSQTSGTVSLTFTNNNPVVLAGNIAYYIRPFTLKFGPSDPPAGGKATLKADIAAVPLPAAAWIGMMLFGGLGAAKKLRGRKETLA